MPKGIDARLAALGIELPPVFQPIANYLGCKRAGALLFVGGHGPATPGGVVRGKVGTDLTIADAKAAARTTALSMLATVRAELGSLDPLTEGQRAGKRAGQTGGRGEGQVALLKARSARRTLPSRQRRGNEHADFSWQDRGRVSRGRDIV